MADRGMEKMKGITCCADCANYNMKKHKCTIAKDEGRASDHFYADCPLPTVVKESEWISVKDRLPEEGIYVLVWETQGFAYCDMLKSGVWNIGANNGAIISHWMPLPEPPKEET